MTTVTTLLRLADDSTVQITITRAIEDTSWGMVPAGYIGPRCAVCSMPLYSKGLCKTHWERQNRAARAQAQESKGE